MPLTTNAIAQPRFDEPTDKLAVCPGPDEITLVERKAEQQPSMAMLIRLMTASYHRYR